MTGGAQPSFIHANAVLLGEKGVLLRGPSGSGKSALSLALISRFRDRGDFARLVGDDRVSVEARGERLLARPHSAIQGMIEIRGLGPMRVAFEAACALHAVVDIAPAGEWPSRYPEEDEKTAALCGIVLPRLVTACCSDASVERIIFFIQGITAI